MNKIVLTPEQLQVYQRALDVVKVCDPEGNVVGSLEPERNPEFIAEMKRRARAPGPRYSGAHVQRMLQYLEQVWDREGSFDDARMKELIREFESKDPECSPGR